MTLNGVRGGGQRRSRALGAAVATLTAVSMLTAPAVAASAGLPGRIPAQASGAAHRAGPARPRPPAGEPLSAAWAHAYHPLHATRGVTDGPPQEQT